MSNTIVDVETPTGAGPINPTQKAKTRLRPLVATAARITGGFWSARQDRNGRDAIRSGYDRLEEAGNLQNLRIAGGLATGQPTGPVFMDSDIYKWLEAVAWEYGRAPADGLLSMQREVTALIAATQEEDGYLDSVHSILHGVEGRYTDLPWSHELYCAGHLFQAAVAQVRATGDRALLDVALKLADHLVTTFGDGKKRDVDGHPVVEMGLVELYCETGNTAYLDLAQWSVDARGHGIIAGHGKEPTYFADRVPVREATTVEGHAVRAVYLTAGATDVAVELGDDTLLQTLQTQFAAMLASKAFITGGLGARWEGEAFDDPYELPTDRGYAETCAAIGGIQWAQRLLLATGEPRYADAVERMLYNAFLAGVSLTGTEYFYVNPLQLRTDAEADEGRSPANGRRGWFECACCLPNIMRTFASIAAYAVTESDTGLQIQQYMSGDFGNNRAAIHVESGLPFNGSVRIEILRSSGTWTLGLRIPGWSDATVVTVNGEAVHLERDADHLDIARDFTAADIIEIDFDLTPRVFRADRRIDASRSSIAIERGPLVYAVEHVDQPDIAIDDMRVAARATFTEQPREDLFEGLVGLRFPAEVPTPTTPAWPYTRVTDSEAAAPANHRSVELNAVPYFAWANREIGPMRVWLPAAD